MVGNSYSEVEAMMTAVYAKVYFFLAHEMIERFGRDGHEALKSAIRKYAQNRGVTDRKRHESNGIPVNLVSLFTKGGFPAQTGFRMTEHELTLDAWRAEVFECPLHKVWKDLDGLKEGSTYCEELHEAMYQAYEPRIRLELPRLLTHGDDRCDFKVTLR